MSQLALPAGKSLMLLRKPELLAPAEDRQQFSDPQEAFLELCAMANGRFGKIDSSLMATQALLVTQGGDWPVQRAAMEALIRRYQFFKRDELRISLRPKKDSVLGNYGTRRLGSKARPYLTVISSLNPLTASCGCPDFIRSSLGICKHVFAVLDEIYKNANKLERARSEYSNNYNELHLKWVPIRPLLGPGDWLAQIQICGVLKHTQNSNAWIKARRWFDNVGNGNFSLLDTQLENPTARLKIISVLQALCETKPNKQTSNLKCDPAAANLLAIEHERLKRLESINVPRAKILRHLKTLNQKLYPYQVDAVERFMRCGGRLLLADDMGLGKTIEAIAICHTLWRLRHVKKGLIVVPASLKSQWCREWQLFSKVPINIVEGPADRRLVQYEKCRSGFLLANYEQALRDIDIMKKFEPDIVVLDEAQRIKNWATKTSAQIKKLAPVYRLVLTGTPLENRLDELASIMEWVDPLAIEPVWRLTPWHTLLVDGRHEVAGARNLDTLRLRLKYCMLRRVRQEVLKQLPPRTDTCVPITMTAIQREEHNSFNQPIASLVQRNKNRPLTQPEFLRLMQMLNCQRLICDGMALYNFIDVWPSLADVTQPNEALLTGLFTPKLVELRELVSALAVMQRQKIVIFSQWRRMLRLCHWGIADILAQAGLRAVFFSGEETQKRRTQNIIEFHDDPRVSLLFATDAGGVGLNLQRAANCCINIDLPWNPAVLEQRIGRIYRLGQKKPIEIYNLVSFEGIESRIVELIGNKKALFTGLFDGDSNEITFEKSGNFLTRIQKIFDPQDLESAEFDSNEDEDVRSSDPDLSDSLIVESTPKVAPQDAVLETKLPQSEPEITSASNQTAEQVSQLFARLKIEHSPDGGISIQAPADTAKTLAALFSGMAGILADSSGPPTATKGQLEN